MLKAKNREKTFSAKIAPAHLVAFTDETGNSGLNLFDQNQPFFWTGTLLTPIDWDSLPPAIHEACLNRAGCEELHGNQLGLTGIERIAGRLITLLQRYKAYLLFTRIEKQHFVSMKFADVVLDSGLNKAVSNFHYGVRFNRLYLAHIVGALLDSDDREEFWNLVYPTGDVGGLCRILRRLEGRIHSNIPDARTRQLLLDAITWGLLHPEALLEGTRSALDSPNVCALTLLIHELHRANEHAAVVVKTFIHDEQQQFGKHLRQAFEISKRFGHADPTSPLALLINIKEMTTFDCEFRTMKSGDSFGLQVLDVALWVTKRFAENPDSVQGTCRNLAEFILQHGYTSEFTEESMLREVERGYEAIATRPLSPDQELKGRELLQEWESIRVERMRPALAERDVPSAE